MLILEAPYLLGECKNHKKMALSGWLNQANADAEEDGAQFGFVHHKKKGVGNNLTVDGGIGDHYVTLRAKDFARVLKTLRVNEIFVLEDLENPEENLPLVDHLD